MEKWWHKALCLVTILIGFSFCCLQRNAPTAIWQSQNHILRCCLALLCAQRLMVKAQILETNCDKIISLDVKKYNANKVPWKKNPAVDVIREGNMTYQLEQVWMKFQLLCYSHFPVTLALNWTGPCPSVQFSASVTKHQRSWLSFVHPLIETYLSTKYQNFWIEPIILCQIWSLSHL